MKLRTDCVDHGLVGFGLGYATAWVDRAGRKHTTTLHRKLYWEHTGDWPEVVRHTCDNARCINVAHLEGGTAVDNMQDMHMRGRAGDCRNFGASNGRTKLTTEEVLLIRKLFVKGCKEFGGNALARRFNIGRTQVSRVLSGVHHAAVS